MPPQGGNGAQLSPFMRQNFLQPFRRRNPMPPTQNTMATDGHNTFTLPDGSVVPAPGGQLTPQAGRSRQGAQDISPEPGILPGNAGRPEGPQWNPYDHSQQSDNAFAGVGGTGYPDLGEIGGYPGFRDNGGNPFDGVNGGGNPGGLGGIHNDMPWNPNWSYGSNPSPDGGPDSSPPDDNGPGNLSTGNTRRLGGIRQGLNIMPDHFAQYGPQPGTTNPFGGLAGINNDPNAGNRGAGNPYGSGIPDSLVGGLGFGSGLPAGGWLRPSGYADQSRGIPGSQMAAQRSLFY